MDHTSAVIDVDYSPTGREFVSGSYDKTVRIFQSDRGHSRDVYHTKRMQRLTCVKWTFDNKYILSGSDEMNIRMWKARASEKLGVVSIYLISLLVNSKICCVDHTLCEKPKKKIITITTSSQN